MRALLVASLVFIAALAGCTGKKGGDEDLHYTCPNGTVIHEDDYEDALGNLTEDSQIVDFLKTKCPKTGGSGTGSKTNSTTLAPNKMPILKLNVTDFGGNATIVTMKGGNLTFDATGSTDPDGQISAIAITVKDVNQTRTRSLYDANTKKFTPQTLVFDRAGPVNISVAMVDDRAGFTTNVSHVYVNEQFGFTFTNMVPGPPDDELLAHPCQGAAPTFAESASIVDGQYFKPGGITVSSPAGYIEAKPGGSTLVTICDPTKSPISATKSGDASVLTDNTETLPAAPGTDNYSVGLYVETPGTATATVIVHYEPKPAAAA